MLVDEDLLYFYEVPTGQVITFARGLEVGSPEEEGVLFGGFVVDAEQLLFSRTPACVLEQVVVGPVGVKTVRQRKQVDERLTALVNEACRNDVVRICRAGKRVLGLEDGLRVVSRPLGQGGHCLALNGLRLE